MVNTIHTLPLSEPPALSEPALSEPLIISCLSVSGMFVSAEEHVMHFVGWETTPSIEGAGHERRIVLRFDTTVTEARALWRDIGEALPKGH